MQVDYLCMTPAHSHLKQPHNLDEIMQAKALLEDHLKEKCSLVCNQQLSFKYLERSFFKFKVIVENTVDPVNNIKMTYIACQNDINSTSQNIMQLSKYCSTWLNISCNFPTTSACPSHNTHNFSEFIIHFPQKYTPFLSCMIYF